MVKAAILFVQHNKWNEFMLYFLWALTACYHLFALGMLAVALRSHEALHVVTIYEATSIAVGSLSGNMVLAEYQGQTGTELGFYIPCVLLIMCAALPPAHPPIGVSRASACIGPRARSAYCGSQPGRLPAG